MKITRNIHIGNRTLELEIHLWRFLAIAKFLKSILVLGIAVLALEDSSTILGLH